MAVRTTARARNPAPAASSAIPSRGPNLATAAANTTPMSSQARAEDGRRRCRPGRASQSEVTRPMGMEAMT